MNIIGEVEGKTALLLDDMVDTAGTITQAAEALKKKAHQGLRLLHARGAFGKRDRKNRQLLHKGSGRDEQHSEAGREQVGRR